MVCVSHLTRFVLCTFLPHILAQQKVHDPTIGVCIVRPLRMPSTKELDINPCCSSWIIGSVSSWILMFVANLRVTKAFEKLQHLQLCPPNYFQQKKRTVSDPLRVLVIFSSLHVVWGCFPAILNHGCPAFPPPIPRLKTTQTNQKCYVQRPWWLWGKMNTVTGWEVFVQTHGGKFAFWFFRRQTFCWYLLLMVSNSYGSIIISDWVSSSKHVGRKKGMYRVFCLGPTDPLRVEAVKWQFSSWNTLRLCSCL